MAAVNLGLAGIMGSKAVVVGILCLLSGTLATSAPPQIKKYGAKGHSFVLPLKQLHEGTKVTSMALKFKGDIAVYWDGEEVFYYGIFNSTSTLDMNTRALTISDLKTQFAGEYLAEVNDIPTQSLILAVIENLVYGVKGQSITLEPKVADVHVQTAQWEHNNTIIALLDGGKPKSGLILNSNNSLTILDLQKNNSGLYTFTNDYGTIYYLLTVRDAMLELSITKQCNSTICTLNCMGADNESIEVSWTDNKGGKKSGPVLVVERSPHLNVTYTCTSDSGSWNTKSVSEKELFSDPFSGDTGPNLWEILIPVAVAVAVAVLVLVLIAVGVTVYWYMTRRGQPQNNGHTAVPGEEDDGNPPNGRMEGDREEAEDEV